MIGQDRYWIRGARVIDPAQEIDGEYDVYIEAGCIQAIAERPVGFTADRELEVPNHILCPGLVDLAARLREPGQEHKGSIRSETAAAACAGVTTLCCPPDTSPIIETPADVRLIRQRTKEAGLARVYPLGALTQGLEGRQITDMAALKTAGCVGLSNVRRPFVNALVERRAFEYAATHDITVFLSPEDSFLRNEGCAHEGMVATRLGLPGTPETAETVAVARDLELIRQTGVRAHFCRLSTSRAMSMIARAQREGLPVTADVSAHQLHLTEMDLVEFNANCHVEPPLRTQRDRDGLRWGLANGPIAAVCSDHQPHDDDAKLAPFPETEPGISALETFLPLVLRLVDQGLLNYSEALARVTCKPAEILGLDAGHLRPGTPADVCIFHPEMHWTVHPHQLISRGRNTPFSGWELKGKVTHTFLDGRLVFATNHRENEP